MITVEKLEKGTYFDDAFKISFRYDPTTVASLNAELNTVMLRRKKEEVLDLPPKLYSTEYVELTTAQKKQYRDIKNGIVADMENILASVNPLNCTLRLRQLTSGNGYYQSTR